MPREMTQCDKCGDTSNSAPNLPCGRVDRVDDEPCTGTYRELKTFVITASVYVDSVATPEFAAEQVRRSNEGMGMERYGIEIRLPDPDSGFEWSCVGEPEEDPPVEGATEEEPSYTIDQTQFTEPEITLVEVWVQMREPDPGDYTLGSRSPQCVEIHVDDSNHITKKVEPTAKQLEIVENFRTNERIVEAGGEVTYEMLPDGVMMLRSTKDVDGRTRITRVPRDGHYSLYRWED